jgi:hypothetical protein
MINQMTSSPLPPPEILSAENYFKIQQLVPTTAVSQPRFRTWLVFREEIGARPRP